MGKQTLVVRIEERLARSIRGFLASSSHGYNSMEEFASVALENQLRLEAGGESAVVHAQATLGFTSSSRPEIPSADPPPRLAEPPDASNDSLFVLTNRLSPTKVAARVLAQIGSGGDWPLPEVFQQRAALVARAVGLRLRDEDSTAGRTGPVRRWVAYPVGEDERAALSRFIMSFTFSLLEGRLAGPMVVLGLINALGDRVALTAPGWALGVAPSPLLDGVSGATLSDREAAILRQQVLRAPGELAAVREFLQFVRRSAGSQGRIDELLAAHRPDWSGAMAVAHRSAMLGRLSDLAVLETSGRGPTAKVRLLAAAAQFTEDGALGVA